MKIAFAAYGNGWNEQVDIRFGRAKGFFVVNTENDAVEYFDNTANLNASQGAGTASAQLIVNAGTNILISGKVGPNASQVLKAAGISVYGGIGYTSIREAYDRYKKGMLTKQEL